MSARSRSGNPAKRAWQPMRRLTPNPASPMVRLGYEGRSFYIYRTPEKVVDVQAWGNDIYNGVLLVFESGSAHLSYKRNDRQAIRDWRHIQAIKNEVVGMEREGLEIFPPESMLVDGANEFHLWFLPVDQVSPLGFVHRGVDNPPDTYDRAKQRAGSIAPGAAQRDWQEGLPTGLNVDGASYDG